MRPNVLLLATGLVTESVIAGPCRPRSSAPDERTTTSLVTAIESTVTIVTTAKTRTDESSATTTLEAIMTTSIVESSSATITSEPTTGSSVAENISHTTALETTTVISVVETTATSDAYMTTTVVTDAETTTDSMVTTTSEAETTTTAAEAITTFRIIASGGSADGAALQASDMMEGDVVMFNPPTPEGFRPRTYILEPDTGRVKDRDNDRYLCGYYSWDGTVWPAYVNPCTGTPGPNQATEYLKCRIVRGKLSCTVPQTVCYGEDIGRDVTCETSSGNEIFDHLYLNDLDGQYILIGRGGFDSPWAAIDLNAQQV